MARAGDLSDPAKCAIPPNPVFGWLTPAGDARPNWWCYRRVAGGGIPQGAMFGSMDGRFEPWQQHLYEVEPYDAVRPCRWLFRYR